MRREQGYKETKTVWYTDLDVAGHDGHSFRMQAAQVRILKQFHQVILGGILQSF
jgi:hypothetical protein